MCRWEKAMLSLSVCVCAYLNFEWFFKPAKPITRTLEKHTCEHVRVICTCFIWDSNRAQMDLMMLGHGSQGTAGSKGIKGCISVHWSIRGGKQSGRWIVADPSITHLTSSQNGILIRFGCNIDESRFTLMISDAFFQPLLKLVTLGLSTGRSQVHLRVPTLSQLPNSLTFPQICTE